MYRSQLFLVSTLCLLVVVFSQTIPDGSWSVAVQNEYIRAVNQHMATWPAQTSNTNSVLKYLEAKINVSSSDTFVFQEFFKNTSTTNVRIIRFYTNGNIELIDSMYRIPLTTNVTATKTANTAVTECLTNLGQGFVATNTSVLNVLPFKGAIYLAYIVNVKFNARKSYTCFVDARIVNKVIYSFSTQKGTTASSTYNGAVSFHTTLFNSTYYLEYNASRHAVFDCNGTDCTTTAIRLNSVTDTWASQVAVSVAWGVEQTYQYFLNAHGRNGMDGLGGPGVVSSALGVAGGNVFPHYVNYLTGFTNAFYTPTGVYYGSGDGVNSSAVVSLDVIAHEWAHGVIRASVAGGNGMYNYDESGALEESFCDVIGAMVENYVFGESPNIWTIGENYFLPGQGKALLYINDPPQAVDKGVTLNDDPDHYDNRYNGTLDNGGVHENNGIPNKAFYLLAKGGYHPHGGPTMTGIGITAAAQIWYKAFTTYVTATDTFLDARDATVAACNALFGPAAASCFQVQVAWGLCGVGSVPTPTPAQLFANPSAERSQSPWALSGNGASWFSDGLNAYAGSGYLMMGNGDSVSATWSSASITMANTTGNATLTFYLKISTSETTTTLVKDYLSVDLRNATSNAVLYNLGTYSNLNATGLYAQRLLIIPSIYKSTPVKVVFSETSDSANPTMFYLDLLNFNTYNF